MRTVSAHAANNLRVLNKMAAELLVVSAGRNSAAHRRAAVS
jgi:hypothetical protein